MSKSPVLGYTKTRMQPHLSQNKSLQLHIKLTQHCLKQWQAVDGFSINLWVGGDIENFRYEVFLPLGDNFFEQYTMHAQPEGDLGERMLFAVDSTLNADGKNAENESVFLVGTDCLFIDRHYLELAATALEDNDIVLGPATDGGYVLLGMKKSHSVLFDNISWGSSSVLAQTQSIIQGARLQSVLLPPLPDIDVVADLEHLNGYAEFSDYWIKK